MATKWRSFAGPARVSTGIAAALCLGVAGAAGASAAGAASNEASTSGASAAGAGVADMGSPTPAPTSPRGDIVFPSRERGILVKDVAVERHGRVVTARIRWSAELVARKGHRDRFNVRLVAFPGGSAAPSVLTSRSRTSVPPMIQNVTVKLSTARARTLRKAAKAVLTVSQQYGNPARSDKKYTRNYVTVSNLSKASRRARLNDLTDSYPNQAAHRTTPRVGEPGTTVRGARQCRTTILGANSNLRRCDLTGANLRNAYLSDSDVSGTELAGATIDGIKATGLTGTPASLPTGWSLINGQFVPTPQPPDPSTTCAAGGKCVVGDTGPGGGEVFYVAPSAQSWGSYMEAAPYGWYTGSPSVDPQLTWAAGNQPGDCGVADVLTDTGLGSGQANTEAIISAPGCTDALLAPAAWAAHSYTNEGQADWFLPSQADLNQLCRYARQQDTASTAVCQTSGSLLTTFPDVFPAWYWSSSQAFPSMSWGQCFAHIDGTCDPGTQQTEEKIVNDRRVRPIRYFGPVFACRAKVRCA